MIIEQLRLKNFRNYSDCEIVLGAKINVFVGNNAQGKTNLLESVSFISSTRSFRTVNDRDMIRNGEDLARVALRLRDGEKDIWLAGLILKEGKQLLIRRQPVKRSSEFIGILNAVVFAPDDMTLFDGPPKERRKLCDLEIGKINSGYMRDLGSYHKTLRERNAFLKTGRTDDVYLDIVTDKLIELQLKLIAERREFIAALNELITTAYRSIAQTDQAITIEYQAVAAEADPQKLRAALQERYTKSRERDKLQKQTQIGIHKDDLLFCIDGHPVQAYASQGQKRMIVLSLKMALIKYIYGKKNTYPVLLLDDVLSELDSRRRAALFELVPAAIQTIITTTDISDIKGYLPEGTRLFRIADGEIVDIQEIKR